MLAGVVQAALVDAGMDVRRERISHGFARLSVSDGTDVTEVDLGVDARIRPAEPGPLGPTLALVELAADKLLAPKAAFESIGDRGWPAILYTQALHFVEFAGPEVTRQLLEEGASIAISPSWSHAARYRLGVLHQMLGDHQHAVKDLTATIEYLQKSSDPNWTTEARFLAISQCELGHLDEAGRLLESVFATLETEWHEREMLRSLAAAAHVLEAAGERHLAARAIGRADPFQDNFVDTIGTVRARLSDGLGASAAETLVAEGAASELPELVTEVRAALLALAVPGR